MTSNNKSLIPPQHLLACPNCYAGVNEGLNVDNHTCSHCDSEFFHLDGVPCWFDSGKDQKLVWEHNLAVTAQMAEQNAQTMLQATLSPFALKSNVERIKDMQQASVQSAKTINDILLDSGLNPKMHEMLPPEDAGLFANYFELMHRDWGWHDQANETFEDENLKQFELLKTITQNTFNDSKIGNVLVIGGGAGRLAYEFHQFFKPESTTVLDINPLLIQSAHQVIHNKKTIQLDEVRKYPQVNVPPSATRTLTLPDDQTCENLFFMLADAYNAPFKQQQFDLIITPWFVDVVGVDMKKTMGVIHNLLKPDAHWINFGPLLYLDSMAFEHKYHQKEILELLECLEMNIISQKTQVMPYSLSPNDQRKQFEQIWCFSAQVSNLSFEALSNQTFKNAVDAELPKWALFTHLPIPAYNFPAQSHPVLQSIVEQIDGQSSADEVALMLEGKLPNHLNPSEVVCTLILENILNASNK